MSEELQTLKQIEARIEQLVAIMKLAYQDKLADIKQELRNDKDYAKVIEICEQPVSYNNIVAQVKAATGAGERTVQQKISQLKSKGALVASRQGREVFYINSGLLD